MEKEMVCRGKHLPEELVANILSRILAKDVLRFRCVSKSWKMLIDSRYFIRMHYNVSNKSGRLLCFYFRSNYHRLYTLDFINNENAEIRGHVMEYFPKNCRVLRFCNGLFLLSMKDKCTIWNPSTREYKELPEFPISGPQSSFSSRTYGFCYDSVSNDYKVVLTYRPSGLKKFTAFGVYSLKSNFWLQFDQILSRTIYMECMDVFTGGALHWLGYESESNYEQGIYSFDISVYELRVVPKPDAYPSIITESLGELRGCLCLCFMKIGGSDLWLMKDYGVKDSWIKLFSISNSEQINPLAYSPSGTNIYYVDESSRIWLYDLTKRTTKIISNGEEVVSDFRSCSAQNLVRLSDYGRYN